MSKSKSKPRLSVLPYHALGEAAQAKAFGDEKHGPGLREDETSEDHIDAAIRHLFRHAEGEKRDPESGVLHLAHAAVRVLLAIEVGGWRS